MLCFMWYWIPLVGGAVGLVAFATYILWAMTWGGWRIR